MPLSRSLFETSLNLVFLIRRRVSLYQFNDSKKKPRTPWNLFGKKLTPEFRTGLYNAWCVLRGEKTVENWKRTPGLNRAGKRLSRRLTAAVRPYVAQIESDWEARIKGANTCVGLDIANFAASLGSAFRSWHRVVYATDSQSVHQSDMLNYLEHDDEADVFVPRWHTSPKEVATVMQQAATMFCLGSA